MKPVSQRAFAALFALATLLGGCTLVRAVRYWGPDVRDADRFPSRVLTPAPSPSSLVVASLFIELDSLPLRSGGKIDFEDYLEAINTASLVVLRGDTIVYEYYGEDYAASKPVMAYSVTKSITSALVGIALEEGLISSINDPVTRYVDMEEPGWDSVRIGHLLQMTSGMDYDESEKPSSHNAKFYYGNALRKKTRSLKLKGEPGYDFEYASGNTQLLGLVLEQAIAPKNLTEYLEEKIWHPMGARYGGSWSIDKPKSGIEKTFCCLSATARDLLRFGMLYRDSGRMGQQQIIPEDWVAASIVADSSYGGTDIYQYQWWLPGTGEGDFLAEGIINQFIYIHPEHDLVIVKQSDGYGVWNKWKFFHRLVEELTDSKNEP